MAALLDRFGRPIPSNANPFSEVGVSGTAVFGGYIVTKERSARLFGSERYRTAADILANISIVAAGLRYFLNLLAKPEWSVDRDDGDEDEENAEFLEEVLGDMDTSWGRIVRRAGMYRFHGFGIHEWIAKRRPDGKIGLQDIEVRPQHTIERWQVDVTGAVTGVWQRSPQDGREIGLPRSKLVYLVDDTVTDNPEGMGWFRHLVDPCDRLKTYLQLEGYGFQRDLSGTPVGRAPLQRINSLVAAKKLTQVQADQLIQGMKNFVQMQAKSPDTGVLLDSQPYESLTADGQQVSAVPQWDLELLTGSVGSLPQVDKAINRLTYDIARIIGIENMLTGSEGFGSMALSRDKSQHIYLSIQSTLHDMTEQFSKDIVGPIWALNGLPEDRKPKLKAADVAFRDVEQIASVIRDLATAGKVLQPDDPIGNDLRDLMGVSREPELDEETIQMMRNAHLGLTPSGEDPAVLDAENDNDKPAKKTAKKKPNGHAEDVEVRKGLYLRDQTIITMEDIVDG